MLCCGCVGLRLRECGEGLFLKSLSIVLRDGRLWAIGPGGWLGGFRTVGYPPRLSVGSVVAESLMVGGGGSVHMQERFG